VDPNDKFGPQGPGAQHYLRGGSTNMSYTVLFENKPTASASAQQVVVTDQLDTSKLDITTFSLGPISFGKYSLTPPAGSKTFTAALDLRPDQNIVAKVDAALNTASGVVTWRFTSLDPSTLQTMEDPLAGFLPPNTAPPGGEGQLLFSVSRKSGLTSGTTVCNQASVVFDVNAPILTPTGAIPSTTYRLPVRSRHSCRSLTR